MGVGVAMSMSMAMLFVDGFRGWDAGVQASWVSDVVLFLVMLRAMVRWSSRGICGITVRIAIAVVEGRSL